MSSVVEKPIWDDVDEAMVEEVMRMSTEELTSRARLLDAEIRFMKSELHHVDHVIKMMQAKVKDSKSKIKLNKALPYLVATVVELLDVEPLEDEVEEGANVDLDSQRKGKCAVIKTSTRQTYFLPVIGLVPPEI
ncbi:unnamed protein product [Heterobilharzia americana]|nr:unnamed protein product [Heterobilharzia americana]